MAIVADQLIANATPALPRIATPTTGTAQTVPIAGATGGIVQQAMAPQVASTTQDYKDNLANIQPTAAPATTAAPAVAGQTVAGVAPPPTAGVREMTSQETVAGQLNNLLSQENPYITNARNRGMEVANSRGLINSSIAAGTSERAAIEAALPIAQQDASASAQSGMSAQQSNQDTSLTGYKAQVDSAQQAENFGYRTAENAQNIAANTELQNARIALDLSRLDESQRNALSSATSPVVQQAVSEIAKINQLTDQQMTPANKLIAIENVRNEMRTSVNTMATLYGYQLTWSDGNATANAADREAQAAIDSKANADAAALAQQQALIAFWNS